MDVVDCILAAWLFTCRRTEIRMAYEILLDFARVSSAARTCPVAHCRGIDPIYSSRKKSIRCIDTCVNIGIRSRAVAAQKDKLHHTRMRLLHVCISDICISETCKIHENTKEIEFIATCTYIARIENNYIYVIK